VSVSESTVQQRFGLGAIDQISFAVPTVDEAVPRYAAMFGGPFEIVDVPGIDVVCRGTSHTPALRLGFGRSGDLEVELVEVVSGEWPTVDWLATRGEGLHHVRYPVSDVAVTRSQMEAAGCDVVLMDAPGELFAYLEVPMLNGMVVEIIQAAAA
jgi:methylmalonyl-CoA/ethylmalonyl-CoA epimerase